MKYEISNYEGKQEVTYEELEGALGAEEAEQAVAKITEGGNYRLMGQGSCWLDEYNGSWVYLYVYAA